MRRCLLSGQADSVYSPSYCNARLSSQSGSEAIIYCSCSKWLRLGGWERGYRRKNDVKTIEATTMSGRLILLELTIPARRGLMGNSYALAGR